MFDATVLRVLCGLFWRDSWLLQLLKFFEIDFHSKLSFVGDDDNKSQREKQRKLILKKKEMGYWKSKVLPKIKKVFEKNGSAKKAAAAESIKLFDESKEEINKEFEDKKTDLQPKVVEIYEASSVEIKTLVKEPQEAGLKKHSDAVHKFLEELVKIEFPGSKAVTEASSKYGPGLVPGPVFFVFEKVSTFIVTEEKVEETATTTTTTAGEETESKDREILIEEDKKEEETSTSEKKEEEVIKQVEDKTTTKEEAPVSVTTADQPSKVEEKPVVVVAEPPKP